MVTEEYLRRYFEVNSSISRKILTMLIMAIRIAIAIVQVAYDCTMVIKLWEVRNEFFAQGTEDCYSSVRGQSLSGKCDLMLPVFCPLVHLSVNIDAVVVGRRFKYDKDGGSLYKQIKQSVGLLTKETISANIMLKRTLSPF